MRITIDWDLCQGHAQCMGEVPEVFAVDGAGKLTLLDESPPEALRARLTVAARYCPTGAITIEEDAASEASCTR
jgi:sterol 14-demethylase